MSKVVVISDTHLTPYAQDLDTWTRFAKWCTKNRPQYIVHLGDVADFQSCVWLKKDRGDYDTTEEISNVRNHLKAFEEVLDKYNEGRRAGHRKMYQPIKILCIGNHDKRSVESEQAIRDIFKGWNVYDYQSPVVIDNILFCHNTFKDSMSAKELIEAFHCSCVVGHSHIREYAESYNPVSCEKLHAIKCPMFSNNELEWAGLANETWSRGFTVIETDPFEFTWKEMTCL